VWLFEGRRIPSIGLDAVAGRPPQEYGAEPTSYDQLRPGGYDLAARIDDMDANGVLGSMCFPSFPAFCGRVFYAAQDRDLALAVLRAYNDCAPSPRAGRSAPGLDRDVVRPRAHLPSIPGL
jgi:hypothetical protein